MLAFTSVFTIAASLSLALGAAVPTMPGLSARWAPPNEVCDVSKITIPLTAQQTALMAPMDPVLFASTLGRGVQNYTCQNGKFVTAGALANLYDIGCVRNDIAVKLPFIAIDVLPFPDPDAASAGRVISIGHEFVTIPSGGIAPKFFDFAHPDDQTTFSKVGGIPSPDGPANIDWIQIAALPQPEGGMFAKTGFRLATARGQPPASCTGTESVSVPYSALYYFFK